MVSTDHSGLDPARVAALTPLTAADVWRQVQESALAADEASLHGMLAALVLDRTDLADALCHLMADKIATDHVSREDVLLMVRQALALDRSIPAAAAVDLAVSVDRNPAYPTALTPYLFAKGFVGLQLHRCAHALWQDGRELPALFIQSRCSEVFGIDLHPAARVGIGVFIDHATGVVIGETAVVEDNVSILHGVTLGGTGKDAGDRHPKVAGGVLLSANASILGNIRIGAGARVGAGSVVVGEVPAHTTVVGVPAAVVRDHLTGIPAESMDQDPDAD